MIDWRDTVIKQYQTSPRLIRWLENFNDNMDPSAFIDMFLSDIWTPSTANTFGLEVWGRIVGVSPYIKVSGSRYIGWVDDLVQSTWNNAIWYSGETSGTLTRMTDAMFRKLIFAKAYANLSDCSVPSLNTILMTMFGDSGEVWVQDNRDRTLTVVFGFQPDDMQIAIVEKSGVLPTPAGVDYSYKVQT